MDKAPLGIIRGFLRGSSRKPLTPKYSPKSYSKGYGAIKGGRFRRVGSYELVNWKIPFFVVPDLTDFKLTPYVSHRVKKIKTPEMTKERLQRALQIQAEGREEWQRSLGAGDKDKDTSEYVKKADDGTKDNTGVFSGLLSKAKNFIR